MLTIWLFEKKCFFSNFYELIDIAISKFLRHYFPCKCSFPSAAIHYSSTRFSYKRSFPNFLFTVNLYVICLNFHGKNVERIHLNYVQINRESHHDDASAMHLLLLSFGTYVNLLFVQNHYVSIERPRKNAEPTRANYGNFLLLTIIIIIKKWRTHRSSWPYTVIFRCILTDIT